LNVEYRVTDYPVEGHVRRILKQIVIRMAHELNIPMAWLAFGNEVHHDFFRMLTVTCQGGCDLDWTVNHVVSKSRLVETYFLIHYDVDLYTFYCLPLEKCIESPFLVVKGGSAEVLAMISILYSSFY